MVRTRSARPSEDLTLTEREPEEPARRDRPDPIVVPLLVAAGGVQALSLARGLVPWNSDQGIVALMGRHIALGVGHPVFCYGSFYGGTLEPHLTAILFATIGMTRTTYRFSLMLFLAFLVAMVFVIGRRFFGRAVGAVAAAYLALPPFFFLLKGLTSDGAYVSLGFLGAVIVYASLLLEDAIATGKPARVYFVSLGAAAGLAWWVHPVSAYYFLAVVAWFLAVRPSVFSRVRDYPAFLVSFVFGSLPWWVANLQNGWRSLTMEEAKPLPLPAVALQFAQFVPKAIPVLFGGRSFYAAKETFPLASIAAILIYAIPILLTAFRVARTGVRPTDTSAKVRESRALLLLLILALSMQFVVSFSSRIFQADPRFVYPIYVPFSLMLGFWLVRLARARWAAAALVGTALAAFHVVGLVRTEPQEQAWQVTTTGSVVPLIRALEARDIRHVYTGYWTAYRLAFESGERIRPGIFGAEATDRYPAYTNEVDHAESPAVVLHGGEAARFEEYLARVQPGAKSLRVGPHVIFWGFDPPVLSEIRLARGVPGG